MRLMAVVPIALVACIRPTASISESQVSNAPTGDNTCERPISQEKVSNNPNTIPAGFWCAEFRKNEADVPLTVCYSAEATCAKLRKEGLDSGSLVSPCSASHSAYCFTITDALKQRVHWRCYDSMKGCTPLRQKAMVQLPNLDFGECGLTEPSLLKREQQTASR